MPIAWGAVAAGLQIGSSLMSMSAGKKGEKKAKKLAFKESQLMRKEADEELRRFDLQVGDIIGQGRASVFASNLQMSGSSKRYMDALGGELAKQRQFMSETMTENVRLRAQGSKMEIESAKWARRGQTASGLISAGSMLNREFGE